MQYRGEIDWQNKRVESGLKNGREDKSLMRLC